MKNNWKIKLPNYIKIFTGIVFLFQFFCTTILANEKTVIMSENGIQIEVLIPSEATDVEQHYDNFVMMKLNGTSVSLQIDKSTVKKRTKLSERVYKALKKDKPDSTFFEKIPDITIEDNKFSVTKTIYDNAMDNPSAVINATTKLNYRYVYSIGHKRR